MTWHKKRKKNKNCLCFLFFSFFSFFLSFFPSFLLLLIFEAWFLCITALAVLELTLQTRLSSWWHSVCFFLVPICQFTFSLSLSLSLSLILFIFLFGFVFCFTRQGFSVALETFLGTSSFLVDQAGLKLPEILPLSNMEPVPLNAFICWGQKPPYLHTHTHRHTHTHTHTHTHLI